MLACFGFDSNTQVIIFNKDQSRYQLNDLCSYTLRVSIDQHKHKQKNQRYDNQRTLILLLNIIILGIGRQKAKKPMQ